jgi:hypothetical protein
VSMTDRQLDQIAERFALWTEHRDLDSLRDDDLRDVLAELREMRRQHRHDVALLTSCRERFTALDADYRELLNRQPPSHTHDRDGAIIAAEAQAAAEADAP